MTIDRRTTNGVAILDMKGKLILGPDTARLRQIIGELLEADQKNILLSLGDVPYMDSCGIGELVSAFRNVAGQGGSLKLLNLSSRPREVLGLTKLLTVFETFGNENDAISSFRPERIEFRVV